MGKNARRSLRFDCLGDTLAEVHRLRQQGYEKAGNWDLAQICQHLSKSLRISFEGTAFSLPSFLKPVARWILFKTVMNGGVTRLPLKAPPEFQPDDSPDVGEAVAEFESLVNNVMSDGATLLPDHPVFGRVTKDEWRKFHAWHAAHHLSFLLPNQSANQESIDSGETDRNDQRAPSMEA